MDFPAPLDPMMVTKVTFVQTCRSTQSKSTAPRLTLPLWKYLSEFFSKLIIMAARRPICRLMLGAINATTTRNCRDQIEIAGRDGKSTKISSPRAIAMASR